MADPIADLHNVLTTCGIADAADRNNIINSEGFTSINDLGLLEGDRDVSEMAKRLASRTAADGRVNLGTVVIKHLQALVFWVRDLLYRNQEINIANWTPEEMILAATRKETAKGMAEKADPDVKELIKFDPTDFETCEDAFKNLLGRTTGARGEPLRYVIRDETAPEEFVDDAEERMYQIPLAGSSFDMDNKTVYQKLKAYLVGTPGYAWIERYDARQNGRAAYIAWTNHYNGQGELSKRMKVAKTKLRSLFYKSETSLPFETYSSALKSIFQTLNKDDEERLSNRQQVEKLLAGIRTGDAELLGAKAVIRNDYAEDFDEACAYFSGVVSDLHGDAQLEYNRRGLRKRYVSAIDHFHQGGGRGRGRFGGRGRGGGGGRYFSGRGRGRGRGRGGGRGHGYGNSFNGIDVSDVTRSFSPQEWDALGREGRTYVVSQRDRRNSNAGRGNGQGRGGTGGADRSINATGVRFDDQEAGGTGNNENNGGLSDRGGTNGRGFGRGAYGGQGRGRGGRN